MYWAARNQRDEEAPTEEQPQNSPKNTDYGCRRCCLVTEVFITLSSDRMLPKGALVFCQVPVTLLPSIQRKIPFNVFNRFPASLQRQ